MRHALAFFLCLAVPFALFAGDNGYKVTDDGGSLSDTTRPLLTVVHTLEEALASLGVQSPHFEPYPSLSS
jgi:hypothetical protein